MPLLQTLQHKQKTPTASRRTFRTSATGFYCGLTSLPEVPVQANRLAVGTCCDRLYQLTRATG